MQARSKKTSARPAKAKADASVGAAEQVERFQRMARDLGCDEDEAAFKAKLAVIARQKPKDQQRPDQVPHKNERKEK